MEPEQDDRDGEPPSPPAGASGAFPGPPPIGPPPPFAGPLSPPPTPFLGAKRVAAPTRRYAAPSSFPYAASASGAPASSSNGPPPVLSGLLPPASAPPLSVSGGAGGEKPLEGSDREGTGHVAAVGLVADASEATAAPQSQDARPAVGSGADELTAPASDAASRESSGGASGPQRPPPYAFASSAPFAPRGNRVAAAPSSFFARGAGAPVSVFTPSAAVAAARDDVPVADASDAPVALLGSDGDLASGGAAGASSKERDVFPAALTSSGASWGGGMWGGGGEGGNSSGSRQGPPTATFSPTATFVPRSATGAGGTSSHHRNEFGLPRPSASSSSSNAGAESGVFGHASSADDEATTSKPESPIAPVPTVTSSDQSLEVEWATSLGNEQSSAGMAAATSPTESAAAPADGFLGDSSPAASRVSAEAVHNNDGGGGGGDGDVAAGVSASVSPADETGAEQILPFSHSTFEASAHDLGGSLSFVPAAAEGGGEDGAPCSSRPDVDGSHSGGRAQDVDVASTPESSNSDPLSSASSGDSAAAPASGSDDSDVVESSEDVASSTTSSTSEPQASLAAAAPPISSGPAAESVMGASTFFTSALSTPAPPPRVAPVIVLKDSALGSASGFFGSPSVTASAVASKAVASQSTAGVKAPESVAVGRPNSFFASTSSPGPPSSLSRVSRSSSSFSSSSSLPAPVPTGSLSDVASSSSRPPVPTAMEELAQEVVPTPIDTGEEFLADSASSPALTGGSREAPSGGESPSLPTAAQAAVGEIGGDAHRLSGVAHPVGRAAPQMRPIPLAAPKTPEQADVSSMFAKVFAPAPSSTLLSSGRRNRASSTSSASLAPAAAGQDAAAAAAVGDGIGRDEGPRDAASTAPAQPWRLYRLRTGSGVPAAAEEDEEGDGDFGAPGAAGGGEVEGHFHSVAPPRTGGSRGIAQSRRGKRGVGETFAFFSHVGGGSLVDSTTTAAPSTFSAAGDADAFDADSAAAAAAEGAAAARAAAIRARFDSMLQSRLRRPAGASFLPTPPGGGRWGGCILLRSALPPAAASLSSGGSAGFGAPLCLQHALPAGDTSDSDRSSSLPPLVVALRLLMQDIRSSLSLAATMPSAAAVGSASLSSLIASPFLVFCRSVCAEHEMRLCNAPNCLLESVADGFIDELLDALLRHCKHAFLRAWMPSQPSGGEGEGGEAAHDVGGSRLLDAITASLCTFLGSSAVGAALAKQLLQQSASAGTGSSSGQREGNGPPSTPLSERPLVRPLSVLRSPSSIQVLRNIADALSPTSAAPDLLSGPSQPLVSAVAEAATVLDSLNAEGYSGMVDSLVAEGLWAHALALSTLVQSAAAPQALSASLVATEVKSGAAAAESPSSSVGIATTPSSVAVALRWLGDCGKRSDTPIPPFSPPSLAVSLESGPQGGRYTSDAGGEENTTSASLVVHQDAPFEEDANAAADAAFKSAILSLWTARQERPAQPLAPLVPMAHDDTCGGAVAGDSGPPAKASTPGSSESSGVISSGRGVIPSLANLHSSEGKSALDEEDDAGYESPLDVDDAAVGVSLPAVAAADVSGVLVSGPSLGALDSVGDRGDQAQESKLDEDAFVDAASDDGDSSGAGSAGRPTLEACAAADAGEGDAAAPLPGSGSAAPFSEASIATLQTAPAPSSSMSNEIAGEGHVAATSLLSPTKTGDCPATGGPASALPSSVASGDGLQQPPVESSPDPPAEVGRAALVSASSPSLDANEAAADSASQSVAPASVAPRLCATALVLPSLEAALGALDEQVQRTATSQQQQPFRFNAADALSVLPPAKRRICAFLLRLSICIDQHEQQGWHNADAPLSSSTPALLAPSPQATFAALLRVVHALILPSHSAPPHRGAVDGRAEQKPAPILRQVATLALVLPALRCANDIAGYVRSDAACIARQGDEAVDALSSSCDGYNSVGNGDDLLASDALSSATAAMVADETVTAVCDLLGRCCVLMADCAPVPLSANTLVPRAGPWTVPGAAPAPTPAFSSKTSPLVKCISELFALGTAFARACESTLPSPLSGSLGGSSNNTALIGTMPDVLTPSLDDPLATTTDARQSGTASRFVEIAQRGFAQAMDLKDRLQLDAGTGDRMLQFQGGGAAYIPPPYAGSFVSGHWPTLSPPEAFGFGGGAQQLPYFDAPASTSMSDDGSGGGFYAPSAAEGASSSFGSADWGGAESSAAAAAAPSYSHAPSLPPYLLGTAASTVAASSSALPPYALAAPDATLQQPTFAYGGRGTHSESPFVAASVSPPVGPHSGHPVGFDPKAPKPPAPVAPAEAPPPSLLSSGGANTAAAAASTPPSNARPANIRSSGGGAGGHRGMGPPTIGSSGLLPIGTFRPKADGGGGSESNDGVSPPLESSPQQPPPSAAAAAAPASAPKSSIFGALTGLFTASAGSFLSGSGGSSSASKSAPDPYYDDNKKKWIFSGDDPNASDAPPPLPPPPIVAPLKGGPSASSASPSGGVARSGGASRYVATFNSGSGSARSASSATSGSKPPAGATEHEGGSSGDGGPAMGSAAAASPPGAVVGAPLLGPVLNDAAPPSRAKVSVFKPASPPPSLATASPFGGGDTFLESDPLRPALPPGGGAAEGAPATAAATVSSSRPSEEGTASVPSVAEGSSSAAPQPAQAIAAGAPAAADGAEAVTEADAQPAAVGSPWSSLGAFASGAGGSVSRGGGGFAGDDFPSIDF